MVFLERKGKEARGWVTLGKKEESNQKLKLKRRRR